MSQVYVLLSGGVDSSTVLGMAACKYGAESVEAVSLHYGQRHKKETLYAKEVAGHFGVKWVELDISSVMPVGGLTDESLIIPKIGYEEMGYGVSPTYVPFRNGTLLSVAAAIAQAGGVEAEVHYGAHAEDAENWAYPDCTPEFYEAMSQAIYIGTGNQVTMKAPLINMTKAEVVTEGTRMGVPFDLTWSCYEGGDLHCGVCPTCRARKSAFIEAGVPDPTEYEA